MAKIIPDLLPLFEVMVGSRSEAEVKSQKAICTAHCSTRCVPSFTSFLALCLNAYLILGFKSGRLRSRMAVS